MHNAGKELGSELGSGLTFRHSQLVSPFNAMIVSD